jgi:hypothetical protein
LPAELTTGDSTSDAGGQLRLRDWTGRDGLAILICVPLTCLPAASPRVNAPLSSRTELTPPLLTQRNPSITQKPTVGSFPLSASASAHPQSLRWPPPPLRFHHLPPYSPGVVRGTRQRPAFPQRIPGGCRRRTESVGKGRGDGRVEGEAAYVGGASLTTSEGGS